MLGLTGESAPPKKRTLKRSSHSQRRNAPCLPEAPGSTIPPEAHLEPILRPSCAHLYSIQCRPDVSLEVSGTLGLNILNIAPPHPLGSRQCVKPSPRLTRAGFISRASSLSFMSASPAQLSRPTCASSSLPFLPLLALVAQTDVAGIRHRPFSSHFVLPHAAAGSDCCFALLILVIYYFISML